MANTLSARRARHIRRRSQRHSQNPNSLGFSELFLAQFEGAAIILATNDFRLKYWLLGFGLTPENGSSAYVKIMRFLDLKGTNLGPTSDSRGVFPI